MKCHMWGKDIVQGILGRHHNNNKVDEATRRDVQSTMGNLMVSFGSP